MRHLSSKLASLNLLISRFCRKTPFSSSPESHTQKLERIADELLTLNKIERHDYNILFRLKLNLDRGNILSSPTLSSTGGGAVAPIVDSAKEEKTAFDVKLEKFDPANKIKVIKEVRTFTYLGLKEAKEIVEKAPVVLKKGLTKEDAERIVVKLKEAGAIAVLE